MIPFFEFEKIMIGPVAIHVWGLLVAFGIGAAIFYAYKLAGRYLLSQVIVMDMAVWIVVGALIGARLFYAVFYNPTYFIANPIDIIKIWQGGAASTGGFIGALSAIYIFAKARKLKFSDLLPYFDILAVSLWLGWGIGRIGCFLTHLHPGKLTSFFLAVNYPGGARFDLGLYESIVGFALFAIFVFVFKHLVRKRWGLVALYSATAYAAIRFFLDFLRVAPQEYGGGDARYWSLTPAQWGMAAILVGLSLLIIKRQLGSKLTIDEDSN